MIFSESSEMKASDESELRNGSYIPIDYKQKVTAYNANQDVKLLKIDFPLNCEKKKIYIANIYLLTNLQESSLKYESLYDRMLFILNPAEIFSRGTNVCLLIITFGGKRCT